MKHIKKLLSLLLVLCMVIGLVPVGALAADSGTAAAADDEFYSIVHLDCGRKYYTVDWVKSLINEMAKDGYTHLELAFGNDGLRFLLDDMSVTVNGTEYSSADVTAGIQAGNKAYYDAGTNEWTEADMDTIIAYAKEKGIEIIPLLNTPGHMDAIIDAMVYVGITDAAFNAGSYGTSARTVDLENTTAVAFTQALVGKYIAYFEEKGCTLFHLGTDEYANDILINYTGMGFGWLQNNNKYGLFVSYVNDLAKMVEDVGMTPMAFNDGIYYNDVTSSGNFDNNIVITYWSSGWNGYTVASAQTLANKGHKLVNTHGDFYYVLGKNDNWDNSNVSYAEKWDNKVFPGTTFEEDQAGSMFCIWSDVPSAETEAEVYQNVVTNGILSALSEKFGCKPTAETVTATDDTTKISVSAPGLTEVKVETVTPAYSSEDAVAVVGYDITPYAGDTAYTGEGAVTVPVPGTLTDCAAVEVYDAKEGTFVTSSVSDGQITFTASHFSEYDIVGFAETTETTTEQTIYVTVNGTYTDTIEGGDYEGTYTPDDSSIASVSAEYKQVEGSSEKKIGDLISMDSDDTYTGVISDGTNYLVLNDDGTLSSTTDINEATVWTVKRTTTTTGSGIFTTTTTYYTIQSGSTYLTVTGSGNIPSTNSTLSTGESSTNWYYSNGFYYGNYGSRYLYYNGSTWTLGTSSSTSNRGQLYAVTNTNTPAVNATVVTFTGVKVGTTYVTVGNVRYTINVIAEDLNTAPGLTVDFWITNRPVDATNLTESTEESNNTVTRRYYTYPATTNGVYSESGLLFSELVPATGTQDGNTMVFWKGTRLTSNNTQTTGAGVDRTLSGDDFIYIRYWNGAWACSADGVSWTTINGSDQIVAYYLQKTEVTDEITTKVADWGVDRSTYDSSNFVLVDYAVRYESGERTPESFPVSGKTLAFHCDPNDSNTVHQYNNGSSSTWSNNYRQIGIIKAEETNEYEVYMITVTMTSDTQGTQVAGNANSATSYEYKGTEYVVWAATEEDFNNSELDAYSSISSAYKYSCGGEAIVPGLEIFNRHGALITYYVRAKVTEDSLTVHYIDQTANTQFYSYNIAVSSGTMFEKDIALAEPWKGDLKNGNVTNTLGKTQTVSADLSTMPAIGAQYRYSDYTCTQVVCSDDRKEVFLYYTFDNTHSFVVDFGLPLTISVSDLVTDSTTSSELSVKNGNYGTAEIKDGALYYTPTSVLTGVETLQLTITENEQTATHQIYIYPATTVYYEEGFATYTGSWSEKGSTGTGTQATQVAGESTDEYGYDDAYKSNTQASNGTQATSSTAKDTATFTFTGTGVDIYTNSTPTSGSLMIQVKNSSGGTVKLIQVATALKNGDTAATEKQAVTGYNIPVASITGLDHDTYTVIITHVVDNATVNLDGFRVYGTLQTEPDFYKTDGEDNPTFIDLRDKVLAGLNVKTEESKYATQIARETLSQVYDKNSSTEGAVVVSADGALTTENVQDLLDNGPKNEIYLQPNQALTFKITTTREVQIGLKALDKATTYTINSGTETNLNTSTDMFYTVLNSNTSGEQTITVTNKGSGILAITKLKICDDPNATLGALTEEDLIPALLSLGFEAEPETAYADATLTVRVGKAVTTLTKTGVAGESATFTAGEIRAAVSALVGRDCGQVKPAYRDITVAYGESRTVTFTVGGNRVGTFPFPGFGR